MMGGERVTTESSVTVPTVKYLRKEGILPHIDGKIELSKFKPSPKKKDSQMNEFQEI